MKQTNIELHLEDKRVEPLLGHVAGSFKAYLGFERSYLKRNNAPVKGGSLEEAVKREVLEETGLECEIIRQVGVMNQVFPERRF